MTTQEPAIYNPGIFDQTDLAAAREIVLTPENGVSVDTRFATETPWLLNLIAQHIAPQGLVVDFGCGVGRLSGPLVQQGYAVIGVDRSAVMRQHATEQVANDRFVAVAPMMFDQLVTVGVQADAVLAIWVLQHCFSLDDEVARIHRALKQGGVLGIADMRHRAVPTNQGWINDGKSVLACLSRHFTLVQQVPYDPPNAPQNLRDNAYIAFFRKDQ